LTGPRLWVVRHGETAWSACGRHTSRSDLPLTELGEDEALALKPLLSEQQFPLVLSSPMQRAARTAELAGFTAVTDNDLVEWDYGELEGLTTEQIRDRYPGWTIWEGPWPGGESPVQVAARADRALQRARAVGGDVLMFAHGHILRVLTARWLRRPPTDGRILILRTGAVGVLGWEHGSPAVDLWNVSPRLLRLAEA